MVISRRTLLLASAASAVPSWAVGQCVTDTPAVDACRGGVYVGGAPSLDLNFIGGTLDPRITFTRAAGPATYFDVAGVLQTAGTNVARFDFDPVTHAPRGLLLEEARTNLLLNSATLGTQSVAVTAQAYTLSFYGTGTVTLSGTSTAGPLVGTGAFPQRVSLTFTPTAGTLTCTVTGSVLNANLEAGAFATSYITTAGASATRAADGATMPTGAWFNAAQGTLAVDAILPQLPGVLNFDLLGLDNSSLTEQFVLRQPAGGATTSAISFTTNTNRGSVVSGNSTTISVPFKTAFAYNYTGLALSLALNGGAVVSGTPSAMPTGINRMQIGFSRATQANGWISRVRCWNTAMPPAQLQSITT